jgi:hypothetical protein
MALLTTKKYNIKEVIYRSNPNLGLQENIMMAMDKKKSDLLFPGQVKPKPVINYEFYLDYDGYKAKLPDSAKCTITKSYMDTLINNATKQFESTRLAYNKFVKADDKSIEYWHELKRFVVDDETYVNDIDAAIENACYHSTRAFAEGRYMPRRVVRTQYLIITTHNLFAFNPWAEGEALRLRRLFEEMQEERLKNLSITPCK